jgi:hypothetical protein
MQKTPLIAVWGNIAMLQRRCYLTGESQPRLIPSDEKCCGSGLCGALKAGHVLLKDGETLTAAVLQPLFVQNFDLLIAIAD